MATTKAAWGSDVIVDMLQALGIDYIAINPGASYRGFHDSLVNYAEGRPEIVLCNHEGIAIAVAHGYAHAAGKMMAAAVHDVVGLLNATERVYNAWLDNAPMLVLGGTGPVASELRRPGGDWIHTALTQGEAVREFTKFDDQPSSVAATIDAMLRAYRVAETNRGVGDAEALSIYANAFERDPGFYKFTRTLEAYKKTLGAKTSIVLSPDAEFFQLLERADR